MEIAGPGVSLDGQGGVEPIGPIHGRSTSPATDVTVRRAHSSLEMRRTSRDTCSGSGETIPRAAVPTPPCTAQRVPRASKHPSRILLAPTDQQATDYQG